MRLGIELTGRQKEAVTLAANSKVLIIIGGNNYYYCDPEDLWAIKIEDPPCCPNWKGCQKDE